MATTRAQASQLLTARELALFDAGAASAARGLDIATLRGHIERARELRDKARDQLRRQRLASRDRTGSKHGRSGAANTRSVRKAELLTEVLDRLLAQRARLKATAKKTAAKKASAKKASAKKASAKKTTAKKTTAKKATAKKTTAKKTTAKKVAAKKVAAKKVAAKKTTAKKATAKKATAKKATAKKATAKKATAKKATAKKTAAKKATAKKTAAKKTTAKKATAKKVTAKKTAAKTAANKASNRRNGNTSSAPSAAASVVTKSSAPAAHRQTDGQPAGHADDTQPRMLFGSIELSPKAPMPMEPPGTSRAAASNAGFVSDQARAKAQERHFGEMRGRAIHGHISASGRRNQGKRDNRGEE